jgi:spore germination protein GerM
VTRARGPRARLAILPRGALLLGAAVLGGCSTGGEPADAASPHGQVDAAIPRPADAAAAAPIRRQAVVIYYPSTAGAGLAAEEHQIFLTRAPGDRAKQIVNDLISGPTREQGLRALPAGTRLRQVYVLDDGTAWVDLSADLQQGIGGGSAEELLTVYAIVNSIALNVPEIRRVGLLIDGRPVETLNGHMDLRRPLPPDRSLIAGEEPSAEPPSEIVGAPGALDRSAA